MEKYYIKAPPGHTIKQKIPFGKKFKTITSLILISIGVMAFTTVAYPLISYQILVAPKLQRTTTLSPIPNSPIEVQRARATEPQFLPEMINTSLDYTDANTWFPRALKQTGAKDRTFYTFSIPRLGIENAVVKVGAEDLKESLIHYGGTALPGNLGNPVIFGHSVLPQFFDPTNYTSIFSTLHTLGVGDEILIDYDGVKYTYVIREMYEVIPEDISSLGQSYDNYHLTVITCTPPGTYLRRLIVKATLQ